MVGLKLFIRFLACCLPCHLCGTDWQAPQSELKEYRRAVESVDSINSALAEHAWSFHHAVDWSKAIVLDQQPNLHQRLTNVDEVEELTINIEIMD